MRFAIRADASNEIGTGHVMRCLTLAMKLRERKHEVFFLSKNHIGNINKLIEKHGFLLAPLEVNQDQRSVYEMLQHSHWVGGTQDQDAKECINAIEKYFTFAPDWVIVDHYGLDSHWHRIIQNHYSSSKLMVIDDLADRKYFCDLLLDQTYGQKDNAYANLLEKECKQLLGTKFALLRDEFSRINDSILKYREKRSQSRLNHLLIMMGGTDHLNMSAKVLKSVANYDFFEKITVVLGSTASHKNNIKYLCQNINNASLIIDSNNISQLLLKHDLCIGAAGASSWERCAMGLPSLIMAFAENQKSIASNLSSSGACLYLSRDFSDNELKKLLDKALFSENYMPMVKKSLDICDGNGALKIVEILENEINQKY